MADLALLLQFEQFADLVLGGELGVDAVQLEQVDGVDAEAAQAHLTLLAKILRITQHRPHVGARSQQSGLGRDDDSVVGMQRLADQLLGDVGAIRVGGVDEVDPEFDGATQHPQAFIAVLRRTPDPLAGQPHCAEAQPVDG